METNKINILVQIVIITDNNNITGWIRKQVTLTLGGQNSVDNKIMEHFHNVFTTFKVSHSMGGPILEIKSRCHYC